MNLEKEFEEKRKILVQKMKANGCLKSKEVENAFLKVKRELFFPKNLMDYAYSDEAFPIGFGQTISQPSTIAVMLELLEAKKGMRVLEVGGGSGYVCALLGEIVGAKGRVFGIELVEGLFQIAKKNLIENKSKNVELFLGDGSRGLIEKSPFDRVLVSAACPFIPNSLFEQLKEKGRIVAPVGGSYSQQMVTVEKINGKRKQTIASGYFVFVPLKGDYLRE